MKSTMMEEVKCGIIETIPLGHDWEVCPIQLEKKFINFFCFENMSSKGAKVGGWLRVLILRIILIQMMILKNVTHSMVVIKHKITSLHEVLSTYSIRH
jgi:hypothetical protein